MLLHFRKAVDTKGDGDVSKEEFVIFNMLKNWAFFLKAGE